MTDQAPDPAALVQVTATFSNAGGPPNVYITQDPAVNALTLTLTNGLSDSITFSRGTPVAYEELPPGESAVYIYFNGLIDNADVAGIRPAAPDWAAGTFTDPNSLQYLVIAPTRKIGLDPGRALTFQLDHVLAQGAPRGDTVDIVLAGAAGLPRRRTSCSRSSPSSTRRRAGSHSTWRSASTSRRWSTPGNRSR